MSYRFTLRADAGRLVDLFGVTQMLCYVESDREYVPTGYVTAICGKGKERVLDDFRWGLLPFWAKNAVQAGCRSVLDNKSFDYMLKRQRCVIPCSTYFRLMPSPNKKRKPQMLTLHTSDTPLAMAGVYDVRISPQGEELRTCTILSVFSAGPQFEEEVPMLLGEKQIEAWLSADFLDSRGVRDLVEAIAESQPKPLMHPGLETENAGSGEGLQPFPA